MTNSDRFWSEINEMPVRGVSLRFWPEDIDLKELAPQVSAISSLLDLWPARAEIAADSKKKSQIRKWRKGSDANFEEFGSVQGVSVLSGLLPAAANSQFILRSVHITQEWRSFYFEGGPEFLTSELILKIVRLFLPFIAPRYGFADIGRKGDSYAFHRGYPTSGMNEAREARAYAYQAVTLCSPDEENFLGRRLLDIYELNFLSPEHLSLRMFGTSLEDWIGRGTRGTLAQLNENVWAWTVQDDVRADIRRAFLENGYLIVPV